MYHNPYPGVPRNGHHGGYYDPKGLGISIREMLERARLRREAMARALQQQLEEEAARMIAAGEPVPDVPGDLPLPEPLPEPGAPPAPPAPPPPAPPAPLGGEVLKRILPLAAAAAFFFLRR
ncbi:MAG: hypothetical protein V3T65_06910 [Acidobacteriota bacterium]